eukprot:g28740.t1
MVASLHHAPVPGHGQTLKLSFQVGDRAAAEAGLRDVRDGKISGPARASWSSELEVLQVLRDRRRISDVTWDGDLWFRPGAWSLMQSPSAALTLSLQKCNVSGAFFARFEITGIQPGLVSITVQADLVAPSSGSMPSPSAPARWDVALLDSGGHIVDMNPGLSTENWWSQEWSLRPLLLSWEGVSHPATQIAVSVIFQSRHAGFSMSIGQGDLLSDRLRLVPSWPWVVQADVRRKRRLCLAMAGNVTEMAPNVQMSFTVLVALPETAKWPVHHVWSLTLCRSACTGNLSQEISFNLLGFLEGEAHPGWQSTETNGEKYQTEGPFTTVMIRNIPTEYTQDELIVEVSEVMGSAQSFDFFYLPWDTQNDCNIGGSPSYVFVNFPDPGAAQSAVRAFSNYNFRLHDSKKVGKVSPAHIQGLENNLRHLQDPQYGLRGGWNGGNNSSPGRQAALQNDLAQAAAEALKVPMPETFADLLDRAAGLSHSQGAVMNPGLVMPYMNQRAMGSQMRQGMLSPPSSVGSSYRVASRPDSPVTLPATIPTPATLGTGVKEINMKSADQNLLDKFMAQFGAP